MKIDVLTLARAALALVPFQYRPLAQAVIDEVNERREDAAKQAAHISTLTQALKELQTHAVKLTDATNSNIAKVCHLVEVSEIHTERLNALSN
jgi:hypothetical protein